jgi:hypothetical protein
MELHAAEARAMIVVTIASGLLQPICACGLRFGANRHTFRWNNFGIVMSPDPSLLLKGRGYTRLPAGGRKRSVFAESAIIFPQSFH